VSIGDVFRVLSAAGFAIVGSYFLTRRKVLGSRPRRGTEARLSPRGFAGLGIAFMTLAVLNAVTALLD
jgi:hypothetical protein